MKRISRLYLSIMSLVALFCSVQAMNAENKLTLGSLTIDSYDAVNVPVGLENSDGITQLQFDIVLPEALEMAGTPVKNNERLTQHSVTYNKDNHRVLVISIPSFAIPGNSGTILTIPVKVKEGYLTNETVEMMLNNITITTELAEPIKPEPAMGEITLYNENAPRGSLYTEDENLMVSPGQSVKFNVALNSNFDAYGVQFDVTVPEGFTIGKNDFVTTSRCSSESFSQFTNVGNVYRFLLTGLTNNPLISEGEGTLVTFNLNAPDDFADQKATVKVSGLILTNVVNNIAVGIEGEGYEFTVTNGNNLAYDDVKAEVEALKSALDAALQTIATEYSDVKDQFTGAEITKSIDALANDIEDAYKAGILASEVDELMARVVEIKADIDALVPAAEAAQEAFNEDQRKKANEQAYEEVINTLNQIQKAINSKKEELATAYPDIDVSEYIAKAQAELDAQKAAALQAYNAVANEGMFEYTINQQPIYEALEEAEYEAQRQVANKQAYDETTALFAELQDLIDNAKAELESTYPGIDVSKYIAEAQAALDAQIAAAEQAYNAVADEGMFEYTINEQPIYEALEEAEYEAQRQVANKQAYDETTALFAELQDLIDNAKAELESTYPGIDVSKYIAEAQAALDAQIAAAQAAYTAVAEKGIFEFEVNEEPINSALNEAKAEAARVAANEAAYNADLATLKQLQKDLNAMSAKIRDEYPEFKSEIEINNVQEMIDDAKDAAAAAYAAVATEGTYSYNLDAAAISAAIQGLMDNVLNRQRQAANQAAYMADLKAIDEEVAALEAMLAQVVAEVGEAYVNVDAANAVINKAKGLKESAAAALAAVATEGTYAPVFTDAVKAELESDMQAICDAAKAAAAQTEAERQAANQAAYEADINAINQAIAALEAKLAEMIEENGEYVDLDAANAIINEAKALKDAAAAALAAVKDSGAYRPVINDAVVADLNARMQAVADKAAADKAAAEAEADRVAANDAAYNADLATLKQLQKDLNAMSAKIRDEFPEYKSESEINEVQDMIDDAKDAAAAAYVAVANAGTYSYELDADAISAAIQDLYAKAAERQRKALNKAAYQADVTVVNGLQDEFDAAVAEIAEKYAEGRNLNAEDAVKAEIDALMQAVESAYADVEDEGVYESPLAAAKLADIRAKIAQLVRDAEAAGIFGIEIDLDQDYEIYTTSGFRVGKPVRGQMNIIRSNGKTYKVFVK